MELSDFELFFLAFGAMGLGTIMLVRGGDWTIDSAVYIARKFGISPLLIGFTIVAFGTSLPELIVSINANLKGSSGIALGNVIGSNIANILMVCGASALVAAMTVKPKEILNDSIMMIVASVAMVAVFLYGTITQAVGAGMILALILYIIYQYKTSSKDHEAEVAEDVDNPQYSYPILAYVFLLLGLGFIAGGAEFLVRGAQVSATILGVPEAVIGLSLIAFGTSLPELATCVAAALKKHTDLIIGNVIGSNVFNILMIIGVAALVKPIDMGQVAPQIVNLDMWIMLAISIFFALWLLIFRKIGRVLGGTFVAGYVLYILAIYML
ncbi:MAG: calcium/sodium antiporter [Rhodospirillales bacterium]|nr:calcium/sodium antiporter [Rhodospirillales bacterium]MCB9964763.1 calcium/sodium antiporter [Rhodospirillales bacterium]MCB9973763.1 calcium/sodium antiporter [Rhodospirillales bacterium]MCB9980657.1 calcium/sodium antiporter [Rhodospirillales bacterium]